MSVLQLAQLNKGFYLNLQLGDSLIDFMSSTITLAKHGFDWLRQLIITDFGGFW